MDTRQFIADHLHDDVHELALKYSNAKVDMALALRQIEARQLLHDKVPSWSDNEELLFPSRLSIEQCSSEATASYKASLAKGRSFADLTGGLGVDCHFIASKFQTSDYVELNPELCSLASHNFKVLGSNINVHNESAVSFLNRCEPVDCFLIDPARRDLHGRKTVSIADCTPNLIELQDLLLQKARRVMVKLSPMLDISKALTELHLVSEVHVVAVANECKELLLILENGYEDAPSFTCVNLLTEQPSVSFSQEEERTCPAVLADTVQTYLYEPNAALLKGGCFKLLTKRFPLSKLYPNSHLYTSEQHIARFPGRVFKVIDWAPYSKKLKKTLLTSIHKASITTRNFPLTAAELRQSLRLAESDENYLFATTLGENQKVVILCERILTRFEKDLYLCKIN